MRAAYNGVLLNFPSLQDLRFQPVFDTVSGNDYCFSLGSLAVTAVVAQNFVRVVPGVPTPSRQIANGVGGQSHPAQQTGVGYARTSEQIPYPNDQARPGAQGAQPVPADLSTDGFGTTPRVPTSPTQRGVTDGRAGLHAPLSSERKQYRILPEDGRATATLNAVKHRLSTPRGELWVWAGEGEDEQVLIRCPEAGCRCDPVGGPKPQLLGIDSAIGDGQFFQVGWQCQFAVNESTANGLPLLNPKALLSNQFKQTHHVDAASYLTVHTEGEALFRADYVLKNLENPDAFRPLYFLPQPAWAVRENIVVEAIPGHLGVRFSFDDRQTPNRFVAGPFVKAASVSVLHRQALVTDMDVLEGALSTYDRALATRVNQQFAKAQKRRRRRPPGPAGGGGPAP